MNPARDQLSIFPLRQTFPRPRIIDIETTVREQFAQCGVKFAPNASIAIAVGSRGIANLNQVVKTVVEVVRESGAKPFIFPAMGSHGGATAEGQSALLASYGVTEAAMGCLIRSSMEVVSLPSDGLENPLFMDRHAWESDGVILINRIKPHTDFHGVYESGLMKMTVIGLGKERQAFAMHCFGVRGLKELTPRSAQCVLATGKILLGVGIVENAYDETAIIEAIPAAAIPEREPALLVAAKANMPRLPIDQLDVLIVDHLGKNVSGSGMDTNIIGRILISGEPEPATPRIRSIVVTDITDESHGNATGMGLADVVTRRFFDKIDFAVTKKNIVTSGFLERGKVPVIAENDREAVEIALRSAGCRNSEQARIVRIRDTLHLDEVQVSSAVVAQVEGKSQMEVTGPCAPLFDEAGQLMPF